MPITISKAIEILTVMHKEQVYLLDPDGGDAVLLSIQVLRLIKVIHESSGMSFGAIQPREKPEGGK